LDRDNLARLERDKQHSTPKTLAKIAKGYGVSTESLRILEDQDWAAEARVENTSPNIEVTLDPLGKDPDPELWEGERTEDALRAIIEASEEYRSALVDAGISEGAAETLVRRNFAYLDMDPAEVRH
jgi:transcriptional regulator with XRE-family HTH domain